MKKIIESDLIAIAHRILKMRDKSSIDSLHAETQKLYEKLSVLKFYEENNNRFEDAPTPEKIDELLTDTPADASPKHSANPMMTDEIVHELLDETTAMKDFPQEENAVANNETPEEVASFEVDDVFNVPFEKVEFEAVASETNQQPETPQHQAINSPKTYSTATVNDTFAKTITLTLNDRIAFEKHLFNNNPDDLNRVISQLNTMSDWEEAEYFVDQMVKPDFNNWQGKEEYENRFITFIQKRFR